MSNRVIRHCLQAAAALAVLMVPAVGTGQNARAERPAPPSPVRRMPSGQPDIQGYYETTSTGANYGLGPHEQTFGLPAGKGILVDPPGGKLPYQPWAEAEQRNRMRPERGYDDPTAHCFFGGVPRAMWTSTFQILQPPNYVVLFFERMNYRFIPLDGRPHIDDSVRLWQGDAVGRWEGDTLVVETTNFNGKSWLNEIGDIVSHAEHFVERFTPIDGETVDYRATVTDPIVYTRPWTIAFQLKRVPDELLEVACHEDDVDLPHLKALKDAFEASQKK